MAKTQLENEEEGEMGISPLLVDEGSRLLLDNASEGIALIQDGMMKSVNLSLLKLTSYSERELISRPFIDFVHPDDRQMVAERHLAQVPQFRAWREGSAKLKSTLQFVDPHLLGQVQLQHLQ